MPRSHVNGDKVPKAAGGKMEGLGGGAGGGGGGPNKGVL